MVARRDLECGELILECSGLTPVRDTVMRTELSVVARSDGSKRVLVGPIRFLNHDCVEFNCMVGIATTFLRRFLSLTLSYYCQYLYVSGTGLVVKTSKRIASGSELLVFYAEDYFEGPCPCRSHNPVAAATHAGKPEGSEAARVIAKKAKQLRKREGVKERTASGTLTAAEKEKKARNNAAKKKRRMLKGSREIDLDS